MCLEERYAGRGEAEDTAGRVSREMNWGCGGGLVGTVYLRILNDRG